MKRLTTLFLTALLLMTTYFSDAEEIGSQLAGDELVTFLKSEYRPDATLSYNQARQKMFSEIDNHGGNVRCVYTGEEVATTGIPPNNVMNTEHTWPQSKFHSHMPMKSDLHHLFPTLSPVNNRRGNLPFADIPDNQTDRWYRSAQFQTTVPADNERDQFSESISGLFEPREDHKGNVARAMFYMWVIYGDDDITSEFITSQLATLARWHVEDVVDEDERERNDRIRQLQGNDNPFIVDSTLVGHLLGPSANSVPLAEAAAPAAFPKASAAFSNSKVMLARAAARATAGQPKMLAHFINVGQGAATLLEFPCGLALIDTGCQDEQHVEALISYLQNVFARRPELQNTIKLVVTTHPHLDHTMGLQRVMETSRVINYVDGGLLKGSGKKTVKWIRQNAPNTFIRDVQDSDITSLPHAHGLSDDAIDPVRCEMCDPRIRILSGSLEVNPGWSTTDFRNLNNHSLVTRVDFGATAFLFTGDLQERAIETLVGYYTNTGMLDVDVYQVGHHASHNATTQSLIEAMTPSVAVIGVGEWTYGKVNPKNGFNTFAYGHPRLAAIELLSAGVSALRVPPTIGAVATAVREFVPMRIDKRIYATGWDHNVIIEASLDGITTITTGTPVEPPKAAATLEGVEDTDPNQPPSTDES